MCFPAQARFTIAKGGKAKRVMVWQPEVTLAESNAVRELAGTLEKITGASFVVQEATGSSVPERAIIVGPGAAARAVFPEVPLDKLGPDELVMKVQGGRLLLAGGRPRGTLYAVSRFLQEQYGVRWWAPWAATIPARRSLRVADVDVREQPAFEYRDPYWSAAFDPLWKVHNCANGGSRLVPEDLGGCVQYKGFCHTFYPANLKAPLADAASAYRSYLLGTVEFNPDCDIWVAPAGNKSIKAIYVDRIFLVPAR
jgi:hypothetical protein